MAKRFAGGILFFLLAFSFLSLDSIVQAEVTIAELELQSLRAKRELLHQKLTLLEETRKSVIPNPVFSNKYLKALVNATSDSFIQEQ